MNLATVESSEENKRAEIQEQEESVPMKAKEITDPSPREF
ncbi:25882_t:CDS:2 [Gigaspora margarita]|uniref:25882_t:CDS:1 n=1 Tax=Gigaspora margarita TaxID=4874 RepID=A0ABM8W671_GIGMA|nr:25882_t:CDS:2 [Gigaspora margarita]